MAYNAIVSNMKVAIICFNLKWQAGGARLIFSLAHSLKEIGHKVIVFAPEVNRDAFPDLQEGLDIREVRQARSFAWTENPDGFVSKIRHKIREEKLHVETARGIAEAMDDDFDVINPHDFAYKVGKFYRKKNKRAKIIWTENDPPFVYLPKEKKIFDLLSKLFNKYKSFSERKYFSCIDSVVVLDKYNERWSNNRGLHARIIRSGVDFDQFFSPVKKREIGNKTVKILGLGALNKYRRFEDIILATSRLREAGYDATATVIAKNIWGEDVYKRFLEKLVSDKGLNKYISLNFDGVSNEELRRVYRESDIFVLPIYLPKPRDGYGWGLSNFEAMAAGLPLVICKTSTAMEVLEDGVNAMAVQPESPTDIANKIKQLIDQPELYHSVAETGQDFVRDNISWKKYAKEMTEVFRV